MELYTVVRIEETVLPTLIKRTCTEKEIENFKKQAKSIYYHILYTYESEEDRYTIQIPGHDYDNFFLEIPMEDYVIESEVLVGFRPYSRKRRLKENIRKMLTCKEHKEVLWLYPDYSESMSNRIQIYAEKKGIRSFGKTGNFPYWERMETTWQLYRYKKEDRLFGTNTAFRWDEKDTLLIMGNMEMPEWSNMPMAVL